MTTHFTLHSVSAPRAGSDEQWPDGLGLSDAETGDLECSDIGRDPRFADGRWLGVLVIAAAVSVLAAVLIPPKIIVLVTGSAFMSGCVASVILAACPRLPRIRWDARWNGPVVLLGLVALAAGLLVALTVLNWTGAI